MQQLDESSFDSGLSGPEIDFTGFSSSNDSAISNPQLRLIGDIIDTKCFLKKGLNSDMETEPTLSKKFPQIAATSLRSEFRNKIAVDFHYAIPAKRPRLSLNEQKQNSTLSKNLVSSTKFKSPICHKGGGASYSFTKPENCSCVKHHVDNNFWCTAEVNGNCPAKSQFKPQVGSGSMVQETFQKNLWSLNTFEQNLAILTAENPQMTLEEKINAWQCDMELSDVEDVGSFDDLFKEHEELKRTALEGTRNAFKKAKYDKNRSNLNQTKAFRNINTSPLIPVNIDKHANTECVSYLKYQNTLKTLTDSENKRDYKSEGTKLEQSATESLPLSSKSTFLRKVGSMKEQKNHRDMQKSSPDKGRILRRHCLGQESQHDFDLKVSIAESAAEILLKHRPLLDSNFTPSTVKQPSTDDSAIKIYNLDCKHDKYSTNPKCLIQIRQDFTNEKKSLLLQEKKNKLFKLSMVPQKNTNTASRSPAKHSNKCFLAKSKNNLKSSSICFLSPQESAKDGATFLHTSNSNFHKQHEFCNYLGLTGMSTASAVANAVAELAKCNLARRSLRVRRLQQQEKDMNKLTKQPFNPDKLIPASNIMNITPDQTNIFKSRKNVHGAKFLEAINSHKNINNTTGILNECNRREPEIKILCHMSSDAYKSEISRNCVQKTAGPTREILFRRLSSTGAFSNKTLTNKCSPVCETNLLEKDCLSRTSKQTVVVQKLSVDYTSSTEVKNTLDLKNSSYITPKESILMSTDLDKSSVVNKNLYNKFQEFLEASRKMKPSIFIVQALSSTGIKQHIKSEGENLPKIDAAKQPTIFCIQQNHTNCKNKNNADILNKIKGSSLQNLLLTKRKKNDYLRKFLTKSTKSIWHKRHPHAYQKRKNLFLKTIKCISDINNKTKKVFDKTKETCPKFCSAILSETSKNVSNDFQQDSKYETLPERVQLSNDQKVNHQLFKRVTKQKVDDNAKMVYSRQLYKRLTPYNTNDTVIDLKRKKKQKRIISTDSTIPSLVGTLKSKDVNASSIVNSKLISNNNSNTTKSHIGVDSNNEKVVVSTINNYAEATLFKLNDNRIFFEQKEDSSKTSYVILAKEQGTQSGIEPNNIHYLSTPTKALTTPIKTENGRVDYLYYEMDVLIVVQEFCISFWKHFKLISVLSTPQYNCQLSSKILMNKSSISQHKYSSSAVIVNADNTTDIPVTRNEWIPLGECRRLINDLEIRTPYDNRICTHNSIPIYMEMRGRFAPNERRECSLLSVYVNVYYYNDEDMIAKMHSIQLDAIQSNPSEVVYTTLTESRYFVMTWPQENILGKTRTGLCKYSLTPNMDTLASIREFKNMRHIIRYLECSTDDKLLGFGDTQLTIWNHRSGDILMNYDLDVKLGRNLGSIYYPSLEIDKNSMLILFQYAPKKDTEAGTELIIIACSVSHVNPSHRILHRYNLLQPAFSILNNATNTGEHIIITAQNDEEIWISCSDVSTIIHVPAQGNRRFYSRGKSQLIELTNETLTVDSMANHVLKLAAKTDIQFNINRNHI